MYLCVDRVLRHVVNPEPVWDIRCVVIVGVLQRNGQIAGRCGINGHHKMERRGHHGRVENPGQNRTNNSPCDLHPANTAKYTFIVSWPAKRAHPTWQRPSYPTNLHTTSNTIRMDTHAHQLTNTITLVWRRASESHQQPWIIDRIIDIIRSTNTTISKQDLSYASRILPTSTSTR